MNDRPVPADFTRVAPSRLLKPGNPPEVLLLIPTSPAKSKTPLLLMIAKTPFDSPRPSEPPLYVVGPEIFAVTPDRERLAAPERVLVAGRLSTPPLPRIVLLPVQSRPPFSVTVALPMSRFPPAIVSRPSSVESLAMVSVPAFKVNVPPAARLSVFAFAAEAMVTLKAPILTSLTMLGIPKFQLPGSFQVEPSPLPVNENSPVNDITKPRPPLVTRSPV